MKRRKATNTLIIKNDIQSKSYEQVLEIMYPHLASQHHRNHQLQQELILNTRRRAQDTAVSHSHKPTQPQKPALDSRQPQGQTHMGGSSEPH